MLRLRLLNVFMIGTFDGNLTKGWNPYKKPVFKLLGLILTHMWPITEYTCETSKIVYKQVKILSKKILFIVSWTYNALIKKLFIKNV